jgi:hypothetical protein
VWGGELAESTYCRVWRKARVQAPECGGGGIAAGRPYDLRHAAVSTWPNAGVPSTRSPSGPGLVGQEETARLRIDAVLRTPDRP